MIGPSSFVNPKVQFFFYAFACLAFIAAAVVPAEGATRALTKVNLIAGGLLLALAPSVWIFFRLAFHPKPF